MGLQVRLERAKTNLHPGLIAQVWRTTAPNDRHEEAPGWLGASSKLMQAAHDGVISLGTFYRLIGGNLEGVLDFGFEQVPRVRDLKERERNMILGTASSGASHGGRRDV